MEPGVATSLPSFDPHLVRLISLLQTDLARQWTLPALAHECGISSFYMCRLFRASMGVSVASYRRAVRIAHAKMLLISSAKPIKQISLECGYPNVAHFSRVFRVISGLSPSSFASLSAGVARRFEEP